MMQSDELLDILHLFIERHLQLLEYLRHHPASYGLVTVECPADMRVITLACRLADIVKQRRPPQPEIRLRPD